LLDGFRAIFGATQAKVLAFVAIVGLVASFHTIIYAQGRQIYSLSRAGYFPPVLSITHSMWKTPHVAMIVGAIVGLGLMLIIFWVRGADRGAALIGGTLLNMAVAGAMLSYIAQAVSFILLRVNQPNIERPYVSPFGNAGAIVTIVIAAVTLLYQLFDPVYRAGVIGVLIWFVIAAIYFAFVGRHRLVLSPEEEFAMTHRSK
jgi:ethanolamine permease